MKPQGVTPAGGSAPQPETTAGRQAKADWAHRKQSLVRRTERHIPLSEQRAMLDCIGSRLTETISCEADSVWEADSCRTWDARGVNSSMPSEAARHMTTAYGRPRPQHLTLPRRGTVRTGKCPSKNFASWHGIDVGCENSRKCTMRQGIRVPVSPASTPRQRQGPDRLLGRRSPDPRGSERRRNLECRGVRALSRGSRPERQRRHPPLHCNANAHRKDSCLPRIAVPSTRVQERRS